MLIDNSRSISPVTFEKGSGSCWTPPSMPRTTGPNRACAWASSIERYGAATEFREAATAQEGLMTVLETSRRQDKNPLWVLERILLGKPPPLQLSE